MSEVKERVLNAIVRMDDIEVQKIWLFIKNSFSAGDPDWEHIPTTAPDVHEQNIISEYLSGNPEYQPTIPQDQILKQLGISL